MVWIEFRQRGAIYGLVIMDKLQCERSYRTFSVPVGGILYSNTQGKPMGSNFTQDTEVKS